jgi:CRISPR-associated endonuclease Cas3-HD
VRQQVEAIAPTGATPAGDDWETVLSVAATLHDIGKYTPAFQEYLGTDERPDPEEYHADVGAVLTACALWSREDVSDRGTLAATLAVAHHHGALPDVDQAWTEWRDRRGTTNAAAGAAHGLTHEPDGFALADWKLSEIDKSGASAHARERFESVADGVPWGAVVDAGVERLSGLLDNTSIIGVDDQFYATLLRLWGTLVCADRFDAGGASLVAGRELPKDRQFSFDSATTETERQLNQIRSDARKIAEDRLSDAAPEQSLFRLTLPTGFGKTAAGVAAATELAEETGGRVVYALPFTTVVDQTDSMLRRKWELSPDGNEYTVHHHLAETWTTRDAEGEPLSGRTARAHARAWRAGLILTTYVQLFESVVGPTVDRAQKLAALEDAVILLDEPQAVPPTWWRAVASAIQTLCERYGATVILTTATQPRVLEVYGIGNPVELAARDRAFGFLTEHERVRFELDESVRRWVHDRVDARVTVPEAAERLASTVTTDSTLAVTATVDSVGELIGAVERTVDATVVNLGRQLTDWSQTAGQTPREAAVGDGDIGVVAADFLETVAADASDTLTGEDTGTSDNTTADGTTLVVLPLTAALRPVDRRVLVRALRDRLDDDTVTPLDGHPLLCVSTQVIEAGIDVSFGRVFRDLAPVPSLVQTAGRCNRSLEGTTGEVTVWRLDGDPVPSETIYGSGTTTVDGDTLDRLRLTRAVLSDIDRDETTLPERQVIHDLVRAYYDRRHAADDRALGDDRLVESMQSAEAATLRRETMIPDDSERVLVVRTEADRCALDQYLDERASDDGVSRTTARDLDPLYATVFDTGRFGGGLPPSVDDHGATDLPFEVVDASDGERYQTADGRGLR